MSGKNKKDSKNSGGTIALNKKARHDYFIEETYEAGIALQGWEVKSLRQGRANISEGYVVVKKNELFLFGSTITPLDVACSYVVCDPQRTRKLLLHEREISKLIGSTQRQGYTLIPLSLYWKGRHIKCEIALARGKKEYDKRDSIKQQDWQREKARIMKHSRR
ncbi:MAG: SsrA-binding protein SmpB [Succinivibrionaceae bacterium]|jgi:SsrA-binding protein|nr:SsrA-binding protein SmpB [Succinivibrionaceae bacterium]